MAALKLGQLVASGWLDQNRVERSLEDAASACGLVRDDGLASVRATIRSGLDSGMREPRDPPERQADRYRGNGSGRKEEGEAQPGQQKEAGSPPTTEDAIALAFAKEHADTLRYVDAWSRWLRWDREVWAHDETLGVFDLVRRQCREARKALPPGASDKLHAILASAKTVAAVERLAKSDRRLAATVDSVGPRPRRPEHARRHRRPAHRRDSAACFDRLLHQDHRRRAGAARHRLPALASVPRADHGRRRRADPVPAAGRRVCLDRVDRRARAVLPAMAQAPTAKAFS